MSHPSVYLAHLWGQNGRKLSSQQKPRHPFLHSILSQKTGKEAGYCAGSATRF